MRSGKVLDDIAEAVETMEGKSVVGPPSKEGMSAAEYEDALTAYAESKFGDRMKLWVKQNPGRAFPLVWRGGDLFWVPRGFRRALR